MSTVFDHLPRRTGHALIERLLGPDPRQHEGIRRFARLMLIDAIGLSLLLLCYAADWVPLSRAVWLLLYIPTGWVMFYGLMRSGWSARLRDPSLDTPITAFAMGSALILYATVDSVRAVALQIVCLVLVLHIDRLPLRQAMLVTFGSIGGLIAILASKMVFFSQGLHTPTEIFNLVLAVLLMPIAVLLIFEAHRVSRRALQCSDELQASIEQLRSISLHDTRTGMPNAQHIGQLIRKEIKRLGRHGQPFSLCLLDIDIAAPADASATLADAVRQQVLHLLKPHIHDADTLALWAPQQLLLLMPATTLAAAQRPIEKLRQRVRRHPWQELAPALSVTLSAGSTECLFTDTLDSALARLDRALQRARQRGVDQHARDPDISADALVDEASGALTPWHLTEHQTASPLGISPATRPVGSRTRPVMRVSTSPRHPLALAQREHYSAWFATLQQALVSLIMSDNAAIRERLRLLFAGAGVYLIWIALMLGYALPHGMISRTTAHIVALYDLLGMVFFYVLQRGAWSLRWGQSQLALPQILYGCVACAICVVGAPEMRPQALQVMSFIQLFGMATLTPTHIRTLTVSTIALQILCAIFLINGSSDSHQLVLDALVLATSSYVVWYIGEQSLRFGKLREQVAREQGSLSDELEHERAVQSHDDATGLFNRQHLTAQLERERARQSRLPQGFCVALIGLDYYARANARYAPADDPALLRHFKQVAQSVLRETDLLGRWTPRECLALLPDTPTGARGVRCLERLREQLAEQAPEGCPPEDRLVLSCGIADHIPGETIEQILERAAQALHTARASGYNRCVLAD